MSKYEKFKAEQKAVLAEDREKRRQAKLNKVKLKKEAKLSNFVKGYWVQTILTPIMVTVEAFLEILVPLMMADIANLVNDQVSPIYNETTNAKIYIFNFLAKYAGEGVDASPIATKAAMIASLILIATSVLALIAGAVAGYFSSVASCGFAKNGREQIYHKVQEFSFENIDKFSTASLITRSTTDVNNVQNAFMMITRITFRAPAMFIFSFIMSFVINPEISYTFLIVVPVLILGLGIMMLLASKHFRMMFKKYDQLNTVVEENSQAQRTVKSFVNEEYEKKKFANSSEAVYYYSMKAENVLAFNNPLMQLAVHFCIIIICFLGGTLFYNGKLSAGDFSALVAFVMQILGSLMMISFVIVMISMARSSAQRIREVLNEEPTIKNNDKALTEVKNGDIDFNDVNFSYSGESTNEEKLNLVHINLHIKSGEVVGIIGGTGSSKSTLVNLIPRLYDVTSGELKVAGENVKDYDVKTLRDNVSVVLQKNVLFTGSILDNLRWGNENATDEELIHAAKLAQADEFIQTFPDKYNSHIDQGGANVSGGQRQRLCIARALVKKPRILILDDSTSAVDTKTDALIRKAFKEEIPETTKIIIAQRISSVEDCDHIIVLDDGKINGYGTHQELLESNEIYKEIYTTQQKGVGEQNA